MTPNEAVGTGYEHPGLIIHLSSTAAKDRSRIVRQLDDTFFDRMFAGNQG